MATVTGIAPGASGVVHTEAPADYDRTRNGDLRVAAIFSDHMVLQHNSPIAVFGTMRAGCNVDVRIVDSEGNTVASASCTATTTTNPMPYSWLVSLPALPAGGPYTLEVTSEQCHIAYNDVMIGEVWLAGGQSNIEFELYNSEGGTEAVEQAHDSMIRFYNTPKTGGVNESAEAASHWEYAQKPQVAHMSAVAYYYAQQLRTRIDSSVAIGIVDCYIGGTSISCWMSREYLLQIPEGVPYVDRYDAAIAGKTDDEMRTEASNWQRVFDKWNDDVASMKQEHSGISQPQIDQVLGPCPWPPPTTPFSERSLAAPFHGMVERVAPYTIAGVLWYQSEEDEAYCESYEALLRGLITQWRQLWNTQEELPFLLVQLPQWVDGLIASRNEDPLHWPVIREAQEHVAQDVSRATMICTMDCGEFDNIHPIDKRTVGERLGNLALHEIYGNTDIAVHSPTMSDYTCEQDALLVKFNHAHGLRFHGTTPDTMRIADEEIAFARDSADSGFEIAGADDIYMPASANIHADTIELRADGVRTPVSV